MSEPRIEIVLPGKPMAETLRFFREQLGFRLESIVPADDPQVAVVVAGGMRVQLRCDDDGEPGRLAVTVDGPDVPEDVRAPNGTQICYTRAAKLHVPEPDTTAVITQRTDHDDWITGRAGMLYRDLIPGRMNGHLIASHIRIPGGGPVPDNVHFHDVRFQMIYCYRGWVKLVYEDQGEPFIMEAGDCVLQPPRIRHRVLECSDGLEVIEIGCPAVHLTTLDHELELPTPHLRPERDFGGQRFQFYRHTDATRSPDTFTGWSKSDLGIASATKDIADVAVLEATADATSTDDHLTFLFTLSGSCDITLADQSTTTLAESDCITIPPNHRYTITNCSPATHLLRTRLRRGAYGARTKNLLFGSG